MKKFKPHLPVFVVLTNTQKLHVDSDFKFNFNYFICSTSACSDYCISIRLATFIDYWKLFYESDL